MEEAEQKNLFESERKTMEPCDAAYVAGFFDGEGSIGIVHCNRRKEGYGTFRLLIGFTNTDLRVLTWIRDAIGGGHLSHKYRVSSRHKLAWELRISERKTCKRLLEAMLPYLKIKRERVELGIQFLKLGRIRKYNALTRGKTWPIMRALPSEVDRRMEFKKKFAILNKRGPDASRE